MNRHRVAALVIAVLTCCSFGVTAASATPACGTGSKQRSVVYRAATTGSGGSIVFTDATRSWNLDEPLRGMLVHAVAAGDVNDDGWTDLFVGSFSDRPLDTYKVRGADGPAGDQLLLGGPKGFTVDTEFTGALGRTSGAAFADLDGDGQSDLVIARNVRDIERGRAPSEILRNDGGTFSPAATLPNPRGARSIGLLDYDHDGKLDLFITEDRWTGGSSRLFHNDGNFHFTDTTKESGLPVDVIGMGVGTGDLNGDGAPDLFVGGSNRIFLGNRAGTFHEGDSQTFVWKTFGNEDDPAGVAVGDVNRDGRTDIVVGEHYGSTIDFGRRVPVRLYLNTGNADSGDPVYRDVTEESGLVGLATKAPHVEIADLDNNGWPDIVTSASVDDHTPVVFRNLGADNSVPQFAANGDSGPAQYWPSGVVIDADHDGRLDVVLGEWYDEKPSVILRNTSDAGRWLGIVAAPATRVEVYRAGRLADRAKLLGDVTVGSSTGFGAGTPAIASFGLGDADTVDVRVSRSGRTTSIRGQTTDRLISLDCRTP